MVGGDVSEDQLRMLLEQTKLEENHRSKKHATADLDREEEEQLRAVMELSKQNSQLEQQIGMTEEEQLQMVLEKSKIEAQHFDEMNMKTQQLLAMMKQIDDEKPDGWGLKKADLSNVKTNEDLMAAYSHNMEKALNKIERQERLDKAKAAQANSEEE